MRVLISIACVLASASACTNILVSKGASADGSTQLAYNADSGSLYGSLVSISRWRISCDSYTSTP
jgi:hypothetical protein